MEVYSLTGVLIPSMSLVDITKNNIELTGIADPSLYYITVSPSKLANGKSFAYIVLSNKSNNAVLRGAFVAWDKAKQKYVEFTDEKMVHLLRQLVEYRV